METKLRQLIEKWMHEAERSDEVASEEFRSNNWQMGNVDAMRASVYKTAAKQLLDVLEERS